MGVALDQAGAGDADELGLFVQLGDGGAAGIAHAAFHTAHQLEDVIGQGAPVRHTTLYALRHQLFVALLEVAVLAAVLHGGDGTHTAVALELAALIDLALAGGFLAAGQQAAQHNGAGTGGQRLDDITGILDAAIGDDGDIILGGGAGGLIDGGDLRHADARHYTGGADGAGPDADLDAVGARFNEGLGTGGGGNVAGDEGDIGVKALDAGNRLEDVLAVAVGAVQRQYIHLGRYKGGGALLHIMADADGTGDQQTVVAVPGGVGVLLGFFDILDGDKAGKTEVLIHDGQLFHLTAQQQRLGFLQRDALRGGDEMILGHHLADGHIKAGHELEVTVGDDAHQPAVGIADGHAADMELAHQPVGIADEMIRRKGKGIIDDAVFAALDPVNLIGLLPDGHILVDDADAALPRHGDGHAAFGDGIHGGADQRGIQVDIPGQTGADIDIGGQNGAVGRYHQNVIKGERFRQEFVVVVGVQHQMVPLIIDVIPARRGGLPAGAHSGRGVPLPPGRRSRGKAEGARRIPGRADIFFIVVHPPQKVKELCRLWRNSLFLSKERGKTGGYMGFLTEDGGALRGETTKFPQKKSKKMLTRLFSFSIITNA